MGLERRGRTIQLDLCVNQQWEEQMSTAKPFDIPKGLVARAYKLIKTNKGTAGVDAESLEDFAKDLENNLYCIWNRLSSGSYFPPAVKGVAIPKKSGGQRVLGIPTVADRIAQMVVKLQLEPEVEPHFHFNSYGYRPGKSAHQAIDVTRRRCWKHDWVLEFDIRGLFDNIDHELLMKAVHKHTDCKWVILYIQRWLTAPMQMENGELKEREKGTPQGGVISPLLANLFIHYAFDQWMVRRFPTTPFCRYADDGLVHCNSLEQTLDIKQRLEERMRECRLELHPDKTKVVYCRDGNRRQDYKNIHFDFLGYTFGPRRAKNRSGQIFLNFAPAISNTAAKAVRQTVRRWKIQLRTDNSIGELAKAIAPVVQGWINYYCRFYPSAFYKIADHLDEALVRWAQRKFKKLRRHGERARQWLGDIASRQPNLFPHWRNGFLPCRRLNSGSRVN